MNDDDDDDEWTQVYINLLIGVVAIVWKSDRYSYAQISTSVLQFDASLSDEFLGPFDDWKNITDFGAIGKIFSIDDCWLLIKVFLKEMESPTTVWHFKVR